MRLISQGAGHYISENKRVEVILDSSFETECDEPHPVRMRTDQMSGYSDWYREKLLRRGKISLTHTKKRGWVEYLSYYCEGNETHFYSMWVVVIDGERTDDVYDRFQEALGVIEKQTGETVSISRPRKPKAPERERTYDPQTGAASWAKCGHRAELDIDENCYTCHEAV